MKRFAASKKLTGLLAGLLLFALSTSVQATLIHWNYNATISLVSGATDSLGINGETVSMLLTFDDTDVWQGTGAILYFPTVAATASITNHIAALNTASPAAIVNTAGLTAISEAVGVLDYVDLIIDNQLTQMLSFYTPATVIPAVGDNLLLGHLPTFGISDVASIDYPIDRTADYDLVNASSIASVVPEPTTILLIGTGLVGLVGIRRKFRK